MTRLAKGERAELAGDVLDAVRRRFESLSTGDELVLTGEKHTKAAMTGRLEAYLATAKRVGELRIALAEAVAAPCSLRPRDPVPRASPRP